MKCAIFVCVVYLFVFFQISVWWITLEEGFSWSLHTSLLRLETTTSLPFTRLFECETVSIDANFHYPKVLFLLGISQNANRILSSRNIEKLSVAK